MKMMHIIDKQTRAHFLDNIVVHKRYMDIKLSWLRQVFLSISSLIMQRRWGSFLRKLIDQSFTILGSNGCSFMSIVLVLILQFWLSSVGSIVPLLYCLEFVLIFKRCGISIMTKISVIVYIHCTVYVMTGR